MPVRYFLCLSSKPTLKRKQIKDLNNKRQFILENVKPNKVRRDVTTFECFMIHCVNVACKYKPRCWGLYLGKITLGALVIL